jgi:glycosyltransferase involved in cell wall biosynthesis
MRITWLLEAADQIWGGVKVALEDANWLAQHGHDVTILSRTGPPDWLPLQGRFVRVPSFAPAHVPAADIVVATFWTTVPAALECGKGTPVHFCQGYEGDNQENQALRERIEQVYRLPGIARVTISPHLTTLLRERFGTDAHEIPYAIDHAVHFPGPARGPGRPVRVGLVGPHQVAWKDIATGIQACRLAASAGLSLQLVRVTNTAPDPAERALPFPVEWHERIPPRQMGEIYRSLDVFLATSSGREEGFFLPAVEAMACGVPCVLTDIPCFRSHGSGDCALFVPPKDPQAMAEALVVAAGVPAVRSALRAGGLRTAARYHPDTHGQRLADVFVELAGEQHTQRALRLYDLGQLRDAALAFRAALGVGTPTAAAYNNLGVVLFQAGDLAAARTSFAQALALEPGHADAQANLASLPG